MKAKPRTPTAPVKRNGMFVPEAVTRYRNAHGDWNFTALRPEDAGPTHYRATGSNQDDWTVFDEKGEIVSVVRKLSDVREAIFNCEF